MDNDDGHECFNNDFEDDDDLRPILRSIADFPSPLSLLGFLPCVKPLADDDTKRCYSAIAGIVLNATKHVDRGCCSPTIFVTVIIIIF